MCYIYILVCTRELDGYSCDNSVSYTVCSSIIPLGYRHASMIN